MKNKGAFEKWLEFEQHLTIDSNDKYQKRTIWQGIYKNIIYEIFGTKSDKRLSRFNNFWTYYVYLLINDIPEKYNPESFWLEFKNGLYDYYNHPLLSQIDFHGGISYYKKEICQDNQAIKIGCDYQHLWDMNASYTLSMIDADAKKTIDSIYKLMPEYKKERK